MLVLCILSCDVCVLDGASFLYVLGVLCTRMLLGMGPFFLPLLFRSILFPDRVGVLCCFGADACVLWLVQ